jgi:ABC-type transport system involved in cytochrome c biogenesis permease subunit
MLGVMSRDSGSRQVLVLALAVALLWGVWCLSYETTGFPGLNYLAFGFVSPLVGGTLFFAALAQYFRARKERRTTGEAAIAMFISVSIAVVPFVALLQHADYS